MDTIEAMAFLGALMLFLVVTFSALSAFSKMLAQKVITEESRRRWEGGCLMLLDFLMILAVLVWRVT
jgi:hypothetical protein